MINFKGYALEFTSQAYKKIKKLEKKEAEKIDIKLKELVAGSSNLDIKKMTGTDTIYRMRCGDYRVVFEVRKEIITIIVIDAGHRREIYRDF